jgi:phosphoglycolate phosphatase
VTRLALFDCDGTLVDSQHNIILCMNDAFKRAGMVPPSRDQTRRIVGLSLLPAMEALVPDANPELHAQLAEDYKSSFHRLRGKGLVEEPLFDGIVSVLAILQDTGWSLGVATGKSDRGLALCLAHHGIADHFVTLQTADRHPSKPHPSMIHKAMAEAGAAPETTVMIGDTSYDMMMGVAADACALGVAWGYHPAAELRSAGAREVAMAPADLPALLEAMT